MIREASRQDAEAIVDLFKVILTDMELPIMAKVSWDELRPAMVHAVRSESFIQGYKNAILKDIDGEIAGFCFSYPGGSADQYEQLSDLISAYNLPPFETFIEDETLKGEWYLDSIVTKDAFRGKGIGKELMQAVYDKAKSEGFREVGLNVDHDNPRALKLYEAQGFQKVTEVMIAGHHYDHMQKRV